KICFSPFYFDGVLTLDSHFYLKYIIPQIGKHFADDLESYRMLGYYTENFKNASQFKRMLEEVGFEVEYVQHFFGCATGIKGIKK
ncbi:class I SAM-dependent methyltransferase, partial [Algivirga pacifica]|uniref:class I SAM-dependent methyltransferase n=1 Tax=Algivirga pacifica TaxID=1162670 RepID=UPI0031E9EF2D